MAQSRSIAGFVGVFCGVLSLAALGCQGTIGDASDAPTRTHGQGARSGSEDPGGSGAAGAASPGHGGPSEGGGGSGATGDGADAGQGAAPASSVEPGPSAAPLRRLSSREYQNTVRDLFAGVTLPAFSFPPPTKVGSFENNELSLPPTALLTEGEFSAAESIADKAVAARAMWTTCTTEDAACAHATVDSLLLRAYRRPPTDSERKRALDFVDQSMAASDFPTALRDLVQAVLVSPEFLYRIEVGQGGTASEKWVDLDDYALASRLSYFLWETMPDQKLFDLARAGGLRDPVALADQAKRLLADDRARDVVKDFHRQWLELDQLDKLDLDPAAFPEVDDSLRASLRQSIEAFVDWAFWSQGSVSSLFEAEQVFSDSKLAELLGVKATGSGFSPVTAPERKGLLTQPGLLASTSHGTLHSPVRRGVMLLRKFVCFDIPPPPPSVVTKLDPIPPGETRTTREHFELTHRKQECAGCHDVIDPAGYTLENYDALGRYVTTENGAALDSNGALPVGASGKTEIHGAMELATVLAASTEVRSCLANQWFRFAFGRSPTAASDLSEIRNVSKSIESGKGEPLSLLLAIVGSTSFRMRPELTP